MNRRSFFFGLGATLLSASSLSLWSPQPLLAQSHVELFWVIKLGANGFGSLRDGYFLNMYGANNYIYEMILRYAAPKPQIFQIIRQSPAVAHEISNHREPETIRLECDFLFDGSMRWGGMRWPWRFLISELNELRRDNPSILPVESCVGYHPWRHYREFRTDDLRLAIARRDQIMVDHEREVLRIMLTT